MEGEKIQPPVPWDNPGLKNILLGLIRHGTEGTKFDFKSELDLTKPEQKAELLKDITAMANSYDDSNSDFGFVIYGVKNGKVAGVTIATETNTDRLQNTIDLLLKEYISPMPLVYVTNFEEPSGEKWGALVIAPRDNKPYMFFKDICCQDPAKTRKKGEWFVRKNSSTSPGLPEDLERITRKQVDLIFKPLEAGIHNLRSRIDKIETQYDSALFRVLTEAVSLMDQKERVAIKKDARGNISQLEVGQLGRSKFFPAQTKNGPARFRSPGEALGFEDDTFGENSREVFLSDGPAMWLRLIPAEDPQREWSTRELRRTAMDKSHLLPLIHPAGGYSYLRASDGEGMYRAKGDKTGPKTVEVDSVTFAFKTGEVWSVETAVFSWEGNRLPSATIEEAFTVGLRNYGLFLKELGIEPPFHWKAGLTGVRGYRLFYAPPPGHYWMENPGFICATDNVESEGQLDDGQNPATALLPFFVKIFEECGRERPDYLPQ